MAKTHLWGVRPIVTLTSEFWTSEVQWHDQPNIETFESSFANILKIQVEFKYKKPYGGSARYFVVVQEKSGDSWRNIHWDHVGFFPDDDCWHTECREYDLYLETLALYVRDVEVKFRLRVQIEGPGYLPTGSGSGSLGSWSEVEIREFTAIFKEVERSAAINLLSDMEKYFLESIRFLTRQLSAKKPIKKATYSKRSKKK